jgi:hypothetical protein
MVEGGEMQAQIFNDRKMHDSDRNDIRLASKNVHFAAVNCNSLFTRADLAISWRQIYGKIFGFSWRQIYGKIFGSNLEL